LYSRVGRPSIAPERLLRALLLQVLYAYDTKDFVADLRACQVTPHAAQNNKGRRSAIDQRTTRHHGYEVSQRKRKRVEEIFGWLKTVGLLRKTRHRGLKLVGWIFKFATAAYNLIRIRNLAEVT